MTPHCTLASALLVLGCASPPPEETASSRVVAVEEWPELLSETGLFAPGQPLATAPADGPVNAVVYAPRYPLWSNGSRKLRHLVLPEGTSIDTKTARGWQVPTGTLAFKTFFFADAGDGERPVETRAIRVTDSGLEYAAYLWNDAGSEAILLSGEQPHFVEVTTFESEHVSHAVPSRFDCRSCHEASPDRLLGLNRDQLSGEASAPLLEQGWLTAAPGPESRALATSAPETAAALGYFIGNCVHCHNGWTGPNSVFSLLPEDALDNLVYEPAQGSASVAGVRVVPGSPDESVLIMALLANAPDASAGPEGAKPMPPLGVQLLDWEGVATIDSWIQSLLPEHWSADAPEELE